MESIPDTIDGGDRAQGKMPNSETGTGKVKALIPSKFQWNFSEFVITKSVKASGYIVQNQLEEK